MSNGSHHHRSKIVSLTLGCITFLAATRVGYVVLAWPAIDQPRSLRSTPSFDHAIWHPSSLGLRIDPGRPTTSWSGRIHLSSTTTVTIMHFRQYIKYKLLRAPCHPRRNDGLEDQLYLPPLTTNVLSGSVRPILRDANTPAAGLNTRFFSRDVTCTNHHPRRHL